MASHSNSTDLTARQVEQEVNTALNKLLSNQRRTGGFRVGEVLLGLVAGFGLALLLYFHYQRWLQRRFRQKQELAAVEALQQMDDATLRRVLGQAHLPVWLSFPDFERVQWLNDFVQQLWPRTASVISDVAWDKIPPALKANRPNWIGDIRMEVFKLGPRPPEVRGVKVYRTDDAPAAREILMEMEFNWVGKSEVRLIVFPVPRHLHLGPLWPVAKTSSVLSHFIALKVSVEDITIEGRLRLSFRPLIDRPPIVGAVKVSLMEQPKFSFDLTALGGNLAVLPGVEEYLDDFIREKILSPYIYPEGVLVPLAPDAVRTLEKPEGILFIHLIEATNVPKMDWLGKCDPFVELWVRPSRKYRSQIRRRTYHPIWNEQFMLLVHDYAHQTFHMDLKDWDWMKSDYIGRGEVTLSDLPEGQEQDLWVPINRPQKSEGKGTAEHGGPANVVKELKEADAKAKQSLKTTHKGECRVHVQLTYISISEEDLQGARSRDLGVSNPQVQNALRGGILLVTVREAHWLPRKPLWKGDSLLPLPAKMQVKVQVGNQVKWTPDGRGGQDPVWDETLEFIVGGDVAHNRQSTVHTEVWDKRFFDSFAGYLDTPLEQVKRRRLIKDEWRLQGVHQGRISMELQWEDIARAW